MTSLLNPEYNRYDLMQLKALKNQKCAKNAPPFHQRRASGGQITENLLIAK